MKNYGTTWTNSFPTVEKRRILPEVSEETVLPNRSTTLRNKGQTELD